MNTLECKSSLKVAKMNLFFFSGLISHKIKCLNIVPKLFLYLSSGGAYFDMLYLFSMKKLEQLIPLYTNLMALTLQHSMVILYSTVIL